MKIVYMNLFFDKNNNMGACSAIDVPIQLRKTVKESVSSIIEKSTDLLLWNKITENSYRTYYNMMKYLVLQKNIGIFCKIVNKWTPGKIVRYYFNVITDIYKDSECDELRVYIPYSKNKLLQKLRTMLERKGYIGVHVEYIKINESPIVQYAQTFSGILVHLLCDNLYYKNKIKDKTTNPKCRLVDLYTTINKSAEKTHVSYY